MAGTAALSVTKIDGHDDTPFYPKELQSDRCCNQAVMVAVGRMYPKCVSTCGFEDVLTEMGIA